MDLRPCRGVPPRVFRSGRNRSGVHDTLSIWIPPITVLVWPSAGFGYLSHVQLSMTVGLIAIVLLMSHALLILGTMRFMSELKVAPGCQCTDFYGSSVSSLSRTATSITKADRFGVRVDREVMAPLEGTRTIIPALPFFY